MTAEDVEGVEAVAWASLGALVPPEFRDEATAHARGLARHRWFLRTDPGGCWVAVRAGAIVGTAFALVREGLWGLSLYAVAEAERGRGVGRRLLDAALGYGARSRGGLILSSEHPAALRRYARAGFALRPCVSAAGIVDRTALRGRLGVDDQPDLEPALALAADVSRAVRGAAHGDDLRWFLHWGSALVIVPGRGFAIHRAGSPRLLAARDEDAAARLLWACLAASPRGGSVHVGFIAAGHDWAVDVCLRAGLALSPDGPIFVRGNVGPLAPYLPSGTFL